MVGMEKDEEKWTEKITNYEVLKSVAEMTFGERKVERGIIIMRGDEGRELARLKSLAARNLPCCRTLKNKKTTSKTIMHFAITNL